MDLRQQLEDVLRLPHCSPSGENESRDSICIIGLGNADYGDDGFGLHLAARLAAEGIPHVIEAANAPERYVGRVAESKYHRLLFVDAVDFGGAPGSVVLLNSAEMSNRFPQVSTHKISLGVLARWAEENGVGQVWLLGVQPESIRSGEQLSQKLQTTVQVLADLLYGILTQSEIMPRTDACSAGVHS